MESEQIKNERLRIIDIIEEKGEFFRDCDGFVYYWPTGNGHLASHHLRWIADELDKRNKDLNDEIEEYFRLHPVDDTMNETGFFE